MLSLCYGCLITGNGRSGKVSPHLQYAKPGRPMLRRGSPVRDRHRALYVSRSLQQRLAKTCSQATAGMPCGLRCDHHMHC